ncbi:MAG TPA: hypothetical protein VN894_04440 [Polyangiaceae bacterium]|nr:hypothetical protein [Polyangiaceae bacterium]
MWWERKRLGRVGAAWLSAGMAVLCSGSAEKPADAGPIGTDGAAPSPFAVQARRGEVAVPAIEEVEHMCALLTGCDKLPIPAALFPADFQDCVKKMADEMSSPAAVNFSLTIRECGLRADSCASLRACALHGASAEACKGRGRQGVVGFCDVDGRAMTCWHDEVLAVRDCTRGGEQCIVVDGEATCTLGPCSGGVKDGDKPRCSASSTHLLHCEKGKLASLDCAAFGLKCTTAGDGAAGCATGGPACSGAAKRCDGNVAIGCFNGHEVRVDCDGAGLACKASPGAVSVGACSAPAAAAGGCDPSDKARCDGGSIRYCQAGRARSYSCKALGFHRCDAGKSGVRCGP